MYADWSNGHFLSMSLHQAMQMLEEVELELHVRIFNLGRH
jgi:hypothetical protein